MRKILTVLLSWIILATIVTVVIYQFEESEDRELKAKEVAVWAYLQLKETREQKGYIHQEAIELNGIIDECRSCRKKKQKNQVHLDLITKIN